MNDKYPPCFYRVSVKTLITNEDKILLLQESDGRWELPGGGLEVGETFLSCATRELHEELGINVTNMSTQPVYVWTLIDDDPEKGVRPKVILCFNVKVDSFNFKGNPEESFQIKFFTKEEIKDLNLHPNIKELPSVLDIQNLNLD